jgi:Na+-driven multidrug efflux pump
MKTKMKPEEMYASMSPWRLFFKVALPGMISMFAMSIYSIVEGIFIGQTLGEAAFAAVNIAFPLVMINFSLSDLIGVGASVPISIALGKDDKETANNVFSCSVIMIFSAAVLMGSIMFFAAEPLSRMMGAEGDLLKTAVRYLRTSAVFGPFATIFFAMDNYLRISGFVKFSMAINIGCNLQYLRTRVGLPSGVTATVSNLCATKLKSSSNRMRHILACRYYCTTLAGNNADDILAALFY